MHCHWEQFKCYFCCFLMWYPKTTLANGVKGFLSSTKAWPFWQEPFFVSYAMRTTTLVWWTEWHYRKDLEPVWWWYVATTCATGQTSFAFHLVIKTMFYKRTKSYTVVYKNKLYICNSKRRLNKVTNVDSINAIFLMYYCKF